MEDFLLQTPHSTAFMLRVEAETRPRGLDPLEDLC